MMSSQIEELLFFCIADFQNSILSVRLLVCLFCLSGCQYICLIVYLSPCMHAFLILFADYCGPMDSWPCSLQSWRRHECCKVPAPFLQVSLCPALQLRLGSIHAQVHQVARRNRSHRYLEQIFFRIQSLPLEKESCWQEKGLSKIHLEACGYKAHRYLEQVFFRIHLHQLNK